MAEDQKKQPSCEELVESHQASRMEAILPDFDSLQNCFDYYVGYSNNNFSEFLKESAGYDEDYLIGEWVEEWVADSDELTKTEKQEKADGLKRSEGQFDSDFDEWIWSNYESDITDFMNEFHQERLSEMPLGISKIIQIKIELSWGGPQDYILLDWDQEGKCWTGGSYHYLDWYDGARRTFGYELAEQIGEAFGIYPDDM